MIPEKLIQKLTNQAIMRSYFPEYPDFEDSPAVREEIIAGLHAFYATKTDADIGEYQSRLESAAKGLNSIDRHNDMVRIEKAVFFFRLNYSSDEIKMRIKQTPKIVALPIEKAIAKFDHAFGGNEKKIDKALMKWMQQIKS